MRTPITLRTLAALPLSVFATDVTGIWKADFDAQRGLLKIEGFDYKEPLR